MQSTHKLERALGVGRALHVHANEIVDAYGVVHQFGHQTEREVLADVEAHVRELEANVGVQLAGGDFVQQAVIQLSAVLRLVGVGDVLAQVVNADRKSTRLNSS